MADTYIRYVVGDVNEVLDSLPEASVDLVLTSSPFLAVRSYLASDDPLKSYEMGSESTPGAFIDRMLGVAERCRRVLAPHGSLVWELGETSSDSGGAGGDYASGGLREGQPLFRQERERTRDLRPGRSATATAWTPRPEMGGGAGWPLGKGLCMVPELFRVALTYGFNPLTGRKTERWRVRNVVRHFRPNPPVGALADSYRSATSDWVVACTGRSRYFDLDAVRTPHTSEHRKVILGKMDSRDAARVVVGLSSAAGNRDNNPAGAPPLDWWDDELDEWDASDLWPDGAGFVQSTGAGYKGSHYAVFSSAVVLRFLETMCPRQVCLECGKPSERVVASGYTGTPDDSTRQRKAASHRLDGYDYPPEDGWERERGTLGWSSCDCGGATPTTWNLATLKQWRVAGKPTEWRSVCIGTKRVGFLNPDADHWVDCGGPLASWRRGAVLDPFAGTATTLVVAHGHGRSTIGIDLDIRNVDLARERAGMFLTVEDRRPVPVAASVPVDFTKAETAHVRNVVDTGGRL